MGSGGGVIIGWRTIYSNKGLNIQAQRVPVMRLPLLFQYQLKRNGTAMRKNKSAKTIKLTTCIQRKLHLGSFLVLFIKMTTDFQYFTYVFYGLV